tara:strand:+ start:50 stop:940 length:891 start_codon:yes stop_codon:yes gene_type:complete
MSKPTLYLILFVGFFACKEAEPPINFNQEETLTLVDTCYRLANTEIPLPQKRGILLEDLTGVRCVACPNAANVAKETKEAITNNPVVVLGLYTNFPKSLTTPFGGYKDPRSETAQLIGTNIYNFGNILPAGGVNRKLFSGETSININYETWQGKANNFSDKNSIVNLELFSEQKDDTTFSVQANFVFTLEPTTEPFYSMFLLENDINHPQYYSGGTDSAYTHQHVLRKAYTPYNGEPLLSSNTNCEFVYAGTVIKKGWELIIPQNVNLQKASIVVLVNYNDGNNKEVIQCRELKLK